MRLPVTARSSLPWLAALLLAAALIGAATAGAARGATRPVRWSGPYLADHSAPFSTPSSLSGVGCAPDAFQGPGGCLAVGPSGTVARVDGGAAMTQSGVDHGAALTSIACPSDSLCVATEPTALLTSTNPFGASPKWTHTAVALSGADAYSGISCASATLCVAWTDSDTIEVSTDPAGGRSAWRAETLPGEAFAVACVPGTTDCIASLGDANGASAAVAVSGNPAAGNGGWTASSLGRLAAMNALACPSTGLCVGTTDTGSVDTSTNPLAGGTTWTSGQVVTGIHTGFVGLVCPSATACLAPVSDGSAVVSSDPAAGAASYTRTAVLDTAGFGTADVNELACLSTEECLVPDRTPGLATVSLGPPASASVAPALGGFTRITGLACPARYQCAGVDAGGGIVGSYHPKRGPEAWYRFVQPGATAGLNAISCPRTHFCAAVGNGDVVVATRHPVPGSTAWTHYVLPFRYADREGGSPQRYDLTGISCPSADFCLAGNDEQGLMVSTHPLGGVGTWHVVKLASLNVDSWSAVSCPSSGFCVAGGNAGRIAVSTHPARSGHAWHVAKIASGTGSLAPTITAVSCPSRSFCLATDAHGAVHWSTRPGGGPRAWHTTRLTGRRLIAARCRSARFCVVIDNGNHAYATSDPRGGRAA